MICNKSSEGERRGSQRMMLLRWPSRLGCSLPIWPGQAILSTCEINITSCGGQASLSRRQIPPLLSLSSLHSPGSWWCLTENDYSQRISNIRFDFRASWGIWWTSWNPCDINLRSNTQVSKDSRTHFLFPSILQTAEHLAAIPSSVLFLLISIWWERYHSHHIPPMTQRNWWFRPTSVNPDRLWNPANGRDPEHRWILEIKIFYWIVLFQFTTHPVLAIDRNRKQEVIPDGQLPLNWTTYSPVCDTPHLSQPTLYTKSWFCLQMR